jgi:protein-disulfide isomerase
LLLGNLSLSRWRIFLGQVRKNASYFFHSFDYYSVTMSTSKTRPLLLIILAVAIAGGIAIYMSRQGSTETGSPSAAGKSAQSVPVPSPGGGRVRGAPDAPITLVEYGDYQCPTCGLYHPIITELQSRYPGKIKLEYHHFPLIQAHSNAMAASLAAESAGEQGKYWEMHDLIFEHQREWGDLQRPNPNPEAVFLQYALRLGLDSNKFMQSMRSPATRDRVLADVTKGNAIVKGTPTFVLDGQVLPNLPSLDWFVDYVDRRLAANK